jgi:hypothetical protein
MNSMLMAWIETWILNGLASSFGAAPAFDPRGWTPAVATAGDRGRPTLSSIASVAPTLPCDLVRRQRTADVLLFERSGGLFRP